MKKISKLCAIIMTTASISIQLSAFIPLFPKKSIKFCLMGVGAFTVYNYGKPTFDYVTTQYFAYLNKNGIAKNLGGDLGKQVAQKIKEQMKNNKKDS